VKLIVEKFVIVSVDSICSSCACNRRTN